MISSKEFQRSCLKQNISGTFVCVYPNSITQYANLTNPNSFNRSAFIDNLLNDKAVTASLISTDFIFAEADEFTPITRVRTEFFLGLPRAGYESATDRADKQDDEIDEELQEIVANYDVSISGLQVVFDFITVTEYYAFTTLVTDAAFAGGSIVYVGLFIGIHTGSVFMAICGETQILLSFPATYFIYRFLFGIEHFGTLQVLAIFVILGIGESVASTVCISA